ncbi:DUF3134 domain-containing protein [Aphanothece sacrum]|uniref:DUF3134 domain-containing protein n=1 Tax=Aphanothece sacrum FPU1 TaxID=1920663 RepID=A0A401IC63_APHSA|nr:DUF3134 domain-containing protein [Aphanothece sacrum]GBF78816.1 hypothetical protein AsFPU1_0206 [Aphanothece sacrum FPU1]GBF83048.1 hypothetical protein AsFPU3_0086 [Aphanothece sacrum FPU3]
MYNTNPSVRYEPRYEPAAVIPIKQNSSILDWLEATNRLIPRENEDSHAALEEDVEISDLIEVDDNYDDDDELDLSDED